MSVKSIGECPDVSGISVHLSPECMLRYFRNRCPVNTGIPVQISPELVSSKNRNRCPDKSGISVQMLPNTQFLTIVLENDETLLMRFKSLISPKLSQADMINYRNRIESVLRRYLGRNHFINYYEADAFIREMEEFLYTDVQMMVDRGSCLNAFELTNQIFVAVGNVDMDDSDGRHRNAGTTLL